MKSESIQLSVVYSGIASTLLGLALIVATLQPATNMPPAIQRTANRLPAECSVTQSELDQDYAKGGYEIQVDEFCDL